MKKLSRIILLILMFIPSMFFVACKSKIVSISIDGAMVSFALSQDFELGEEFIVNAKLKNKKTQVIELSGLEKQDNNIIANNEISIDYSAYNKDKPGDFDIIVTYLKDTSITYTYTVRVNSAEFTSDDYSVEGYQGVYDGKYHSITVTQNLDATVRYSAQGDGKYKLTEAPEYKNAGEYVVYFRIEKAGYEPPVESSAKIIITKANLVITPNDAEIKYNEVFVGNGCTYQGFVDGENENTYSLKIKPKSPDYNVGSGVGTYNINIAEVNIPNYNVTINEGTLTVTKADNNLSAVVPDTKYGEKISPVVNNLAGSDYETYFATIDSDTWQIGLPKNVGEYKIKFESSATDNYESATYETTTKISKKDISVKPNDIEIEYKQEFVGNGIVVQGLVYDETQNDLSGNLEYGSDYLANSDVGDYTITVSGLNSENYNITYIQGTLKVVPTLNILDIDIPYSVYGTKIADIVNIKTNDAESKLTYYFKNSGANDNSYTYGFPVNVGNYDIKVVSSATKNYKQTEMVINDYQVTKKTLEITPKPVSIVYNKAYQSQGFNFDGFVYNDTESIFTTIPQISNITYSKGNDVGDYIVTYTGFAHNNYQIVMNEGIITVTKANIAIDVEIPDIEYGEQFSDIVDGYKENTTWSYRVTGENDWIENEQPTLVGIYDIKITVGETKNYFAGEKVVNNVSIQPRKIEVVPKDVNIVYNSSRENIIYNGVDYNYLNNIQGKQAFVYNDDESIFSGNLIFDTDYETGNNTGKYQIYVRGIEAQNYDIMFKTGKLNVVKAENTLIVSLSDITYGENINPVITRNDSNGELYFEYQKENGTEWTNEIKGAGTYNVRVSCTETRNYKMVKGLMLDSQLVVSKKDLVITPKNVEIPYNTSYDGTDLSSDITLQGLVNNDTINDLQGNLVPVTNYVKGANVGQYDITYSEGLISDNYNISYGFGVINVIRADNELRVSLSQNNIYGQKVEIIGNVINLSGGELSYQYKQNDGDWSVLSKDLPVNVGIYTIKIVSEQTLNYNSGEYIIENLEIKPATLTITPKLVEIYYNDTFEFNPLNVDIKDFVYDETTDVLVGQLNASTEYKRGDNAGEYVYTLSGYTSNNYNIVYIDGTISVRKLPNTLNPKIENIVYGENFNVTHDESINTEPITLKYRKNGEVDWSTDVPTLVGTYDIEVTQAETINFKGYYGIIPGVEIEARKLVVEWVNTEFTYDGNYHRPNIVVDNSSIANGDKYAIYGIDEITEDTTLIIYISDAEVDANESGYPAKITSISNSNYCLPDNYSVDFVINRAIITTPGNPDKVTYNGLVQLPTVVVDEEDRFTANISQEILGFVSAKDYEINYTMLNNNYRWSTTTLSTVSVIYTIEKASDNEITNASISSFDYGTLPNIVKTSKYGTIVIEYRPLDSEDYSGIMPVNAGNYVARFRVEDTSDYNACSTLVNFTINKINPLYDEPDMMVSAYNHSVNELELPSIGDGILTWKNSSYVFTSQDTEQVEVSLGAVFTPHDTINYNVVNIDITVHLVDTRPIDFGEGDVVINDFAEEYVGAGIGPDVILTGLATNAIVYHKLVNDEEYRQGVPLIINVGEYYVNVKVSKSDELTYEYNGKTYRFTRQYNDYIYPREISIKIIDYVMNVEWNNNYKIAVIKNKEVDFRGLLFDVYFASGAFEQYPIDYFDSIKDFSTETAGIKDITLVKGGHDVEISNLVYVYEPVIDAIQFNYVNPDYTAGTVVTTKLSDKEFNASFNSLNQIAYYNESDYITIQGNNQYDGILEFAVESNIELLKGTHTYTVNMNYNIDDYVDIYTLNMTIAIDDYVFTIDNREAIYSAEQDKYFAHKVVSKDYSTLSAVYGVLAGIYPQNTTEFTPEENIFGLNESIASHVKYDDYSNVILEFRSNIMYYRVKLDIDTIELPVQEISVGTKTYPISGARMYIYASANIGYNNIVDLINLNGYVAKTNITGATYLDDNNTSVSIYFGIDTQGREYKFEIYEDEQSTVVLQTIIVRFISDNHIEKFEITTNDAEYNIGVLKTIEIPTSEVITSVTFEGEQGYNYKIYINDTLTNLEDFGVYASQENNNIVIVTLDNDDNIIYYSYYTIRYVSVIGTLLYSEDNVNPYSQDKYLRRDNILFVSGDTDKLYFDFDSGVTLENENIILVVNSVNYALDTAVPMENGINTIEVWITADNILLTKLNYAVYRSSDVNVTDKYTEIYSNYGVFIYDQRVFYNITAGGENYYITSNNFDLTQIQIKNNTTNEVLNATYTRTGNYVVMTWTHIDSDTLQEVTMFNVLKLNKANFVTDNNANADIYFINNMGETQIIVFDSNNYAEITGQQDDLIICTPKNEFAKVVITGMSSMAGQIVVDGTSNSVKNITIKVISTDGTVSETYTIKLTIA